MVAENAVKNKKEKRLNMEWKRRRWTKWWSALLVASLLMGMVPYPALAGQGAIYSPAGQMAASAQVPVTGEISVSLQFHYPQKLEAVAAQKITAVLSDDSGQRLLSIPVRDNAYTGVIGGYPVQFTAKDKDGVPLDLLPNADLVYSYEISVGGLAQGDYTVSFTGDGYRSYTSPVLTIADYSRHLVIGTNNDTFTIGDVNVDGRVDKDDLDLVLQSLGKTENIHLDRCDLNKDGVINVLDIAYVNHQRNASGEAALYETDFILLDQIEVKSDQLIVENGSLADLFRGNTEGIQLKSASTAEVLEVPMVFKDGPREISQVEIVSPSGPGAILSGVAQIEDTDGNITTASFGQDSSATASDEEFNVLYTETKTGTSTVTIPLGNRVAVKKITIRVTAVKDQETNQVDFAVVQQIKFLKDIVPEHAAPDHVTVKNVKAIAGNESVSLSWTALPNITGYEVRYGAQSGSYTNNLLVDTNQAQIKGLKNFTTYYFVVVPCNGSWRGNPSLEIQAAPAPQAKPSAPDMLKVQALDGGLQFSWQKAKNALYYKVYYRIHQEGAPFQLATALDANGQPDDGKIMENHKILTGLTNGVEYELYVIAGNDAGESGKSKSAIGIPEKILIEKPEGIPVNHLPSSVIVNAVMKNANNTDMQLYPSGTTKEDIIKMVYDGDYATGWAAHTWSLSREFTFTLDKTYDMNYLIYVPRLDGKFRNSLSTYTVKVSATESGDDFVTVGSGKVRNNPAATGFAILPFERSEVRRLKVEVGQWEGSPTNISLAEILFYEYDPTMDLNGQVTALFADDAYTTLKAGVTEEQIAELSENLQEHSDYLIDKDILLDELTLAESLLRNQNGLGVMHEEITNVSGLQPLGVAAKAGAKVTIYADIPVGEKVRIIASQYHAEAAAWKKTVVDELEAGRNVFTVPKINDLKMEHGGSLYYEYSGNQGDKITLQVRRAVDIPILDLLDWYALSESERYQRIDAYVAELSAFNQTGQDNVLNSTEIIMPNVLLSIPADTVKNALSADASAQLYKNTLAWEDLMHIAKWTHGIDETYENSNPSASRQNFRYMTMFAGAFMYAAGSHVGIGYDSCGGMVKGVPVDETTPEGQANRLFGWGVAHEVGHNMDLLGKAEITNNIYSLMVQTYDGADNTLPSRLENSNKYEQIRMKTAVGLPGAANDVFVQLGMYWQLHLAYDDAKYSANDPLYFYHQFAKNWQDKANPANSLSYNDRVAVIASQTAGKDLRQFFTRWGMTLSNEAVNIISPLPEESRAIWYFDDAARRCRLQGASASADVPSLTAAAEGDRSVRLSFQAAGGVMGYEIARNGKVIAFTDQTEYVDTIGTANHMTFAYTVKAVDMLGNMTDASNEAEIRISYEATVPESAYAYTVEDQTVTFTMQDGEELPVTGILITDITSASAYTVNVTQQDGQVLTAKRGFYSDNLSTAPDTFLTYFQKPGADASDTRMWTYDAVKVQVSNVPESASVRLISYPGDNVSLYDGAFVGRLKDDYDAGGQWLSKGTLVIIGNYRGNPIYNTIMVKGRFQEVDQESGKETTTERLLNGDTYLFAELPADQAVSDISNGFFLFVPDIQAEANLQNPEAPDCGYVRILPAMIKVEMYRTDTPSNEGSTGFGQLVSDTLWYSSPEDAEMPEIELVNE